VPHFRPLFLLEFFAEKAGYVVFKHEGRWPAIWAAAVTCDPVWTGANCAASVRSGPGRDDRAAPWLLTSRIFTGDRPLVSPALPWPAICNGT